MPPRADGKKKQRVKVRMVICADCATEFRAPGVCGPRPKFCEPCAKKRQRAYLREYMREWNQRNPGYSKAGQRRWREANGDVHRKRASVWQKENREKYYEIGRRRRIRLKGAPILEKFTIGEICERDGDVCQLCGEAVAFKDRSLDHIVPVVAGGPHARGNVRLAHRACNSRRHTGLYNARIAKTLLLAAALRVRLREAD